MPVIETFSKRRKKPKGEAIDVFTYDVVPPVLRVQIGNIWREAFGRSSKYVSRADRRPLANPAYTELCRDLANEFGMSALGRELDCRDRLTSFFSTATTDQALDVIDLSFRRMSSFQSDHAAAAFFEVVTPFKRAIDDLNTRFLEHGLGYAFVDGRLVKKDNEHLHREIVLPALILLHEEGFEGANEEYRNAHQHYCHGRYKDCLNECLKAFESTMKTICSLKGWTYETRDTASKLVEACLKNGLLPESMEGHLGTVKSALTTAIPTLRNRFGAHGQGAESIEIPPFYAEYLLHETATTIVFLVEAYKMLK